MKPSQEAYSDFTKRLATLIRKNPHLATVTLSNIFTMRLVGNKTHGDLAEIGISEFINQYMYDFRSEHVGKELFRAKEHEEDIRIVNEIDGREFTVSLKAYGDGPLQLSTDKTAGMFERLEKEGDTIDTQDSIRLIFSDPAFKEFGNINVLPLIYDEKNQRCNIMVFDFVRAQQNTRYIRKVEGGRGRKHPVFRFLDNQEDYICEVRYGDAKANALQRGLWTHTRNASNYFDSVTNGWISYYTNITFVELLAYALLATESGHQKALDILQLDIQSQKDQSTLR